MEFALGIFLVWLIINFWQFLLPIGLAWYFRRHLIEAARRGFGWLLESFDLWLLPYRQRRALRQIHDIATQAVDEMLLTSFQGGPGDVMDLTSTEITDLSEES